MVDGPTGLSIVSNVLFNFVWRLRGKGWHEQKEIMRKLIKQNLWIGCHTNFSKISCNCRASWKFQCMRDG